MAAPRIRGNEVHTYSYALDELGKDYNGFNLVYVPGSAVQQTGRSAGTPASRPGRPG